MPSANGIRKDALNQERRNEHLLAVCLRMADCCTSGRIWCIQTRMGSSSSTLRSSLMTSTIYQQRVAEGAMLGIFLYLLKEDTSFRRSKAYDGQYVARQEEQAARKVIWC